MASALDILDDLAPISELSNGRTSALLQRADHDPVILIKRNKPSYVLMNIENYRALMERIEAVATLYFKREVMRWNE